MQPLVEKTFGGVTKKYYLTRLLVAAIFTLFAFGPLLSIAKRGNWLLTVLVLFFCCINTILFPYALFVFEGLGALFRDNSDNRTIIVISLEGFFIAKLFKLMFLTLVLSFSYFFAIAIAPLGLAYLYFHHTRALRKGTSNA